MRSAYAAQAFLIRRSSTVATLREIDSERSIVWLRWGIAESFGQEQCCNATWYSIEHWPGALREGRAARKMRFRVNPTRSMMPTPPSARSPPTGTVTFLFTDIEGSTRLWDSQPAAMQAAVARHDEVMRRCIAAGDGHVFKTVGDAFCTAFPTAPKALAAALAAQQALHAEPWPDALPIRVRMALHTGAADERSGDYFGNPLNQVARLLAVAHGGQTLLSGITHDLCQDRLPIGSPLKAL